MTKDLPNRWKPSAKAVKAIQMAFDFDEKISSEIRKEAVKEGLSNSDLIRKKIGLSFKKPKRPRLIVSLSSEDFKILAEKYGVSVEDETKIRSLIREELSKEFEIK